MIAQAFEALSLEIEIDEAEIKEHLDCADTLALYIIFELRKGPRSEIWPFLATMPKEYTTPFDYWPIELHDLLTPAGFDFLFLATSDYVDSYKKLAAVLEKYNISEPEYHR